MRLAIDAETAHRALATAGRALRGGGHRFTGLRLRAQDDWLEVAGVGASLSLEVRVAAQVHEPGEVVVAGPLATEAAKAMPAGALELRYDGTDLRLTSGGAEVTLRSFAVGDFPVITEPAGTTTTVAPAGLRSHLQRVIPFASTDPSRPVLCGVHFAPTDEGLELAATDSYRLAVTRIAGDTGLFGGGPVIVPASSLAELDRLSTTGESMVVQTGPNSARFTLQSADPSITQVVLQANLIEGSYPNYHSLLNQTTTMTAEFAVADLTEALRRARVVAAVSESVTRVTLSFDGSNVAQVAAASAQLGTSQSPVPCSYGGESFSIACNPAYLLDVLSQGGGRVRFGFSNPLQPIVVTLDDSDDATWIIMPVRA